MNQFNVFLTRFKIGKILVNLDPIRIVFNWPQSVINMKPTPNQSNSKYLNIHVLRNFNCTENICRKHIILFELFCFEGYNYNIIILKGTIITLLISYLLSKTIHINFIVPGLCQISSQFALANLMIIGTIKQRHSWPKT